MNGFVTDIVRGSFHDGPGIRTVVFLQGCSLQCQWCHNPETWSELPEPLFYPGKCTGCGLCEGKSKNAGLCRYGARVMSSEEKTVDEVMAVIKSDRAFYKDGGGVTFSGGEPCDQPDFLMELLEQCRKEKISTAVETNLNYPVDTLKRVLPHLDLLMADLKMMDAERHQQYTGESNDLILANLEFLTDCDIPVIVRTPVMAGINDDDANIEQTVAVLKKIKSLHYYEVLRYHSLGKEKYESLGWECPVFEPPSDERLGVICSKVKEAGIKLLLDGRER